MDIRTYVLALAEEARLGPRSLARASSSQKNNSLAKMAESITKKTAELVKENSKDEESSLLMPLP